MNQPEPSAPFADEALAAFVTGLAKGPPMSSLGDPAELRRQTAARAMQRPPGPEMPTQDVVLAELQHANAALPTDG